MSHIGEFDLIGRISSRFAGKDNCSTAPDGVLGIGDDCAVIPQRAGMDTLVTTDLLIEDRHFLLSDISPEQLGWKSAAVNISDIAAMGGRPVATFLSIALPKRLPLRQEVHPVDQSPDHWYREGLFRLPDGGEKSSPVEDGCADSEGGSVEKWVDRFIDGYKAMCDKFGVPLLGGDTSASPDKLFINVTVLGECPHGNALRRSGARPGDLICVTGTLGDSAAGLRLVLERSAASLRPVLERSEGHSEFQSCQTETHSCHSEQSEESPLAPERTSSHSEPHSCHSERSEESPLAPELTLIRRHYCPMPRVAEGQTLAAVPGVHAMMDISDGIASDLRHILKASGPRNGEFSPGSAESGVFGPKNADFSPVAAESVAFGPQNAEFSPVAAESDASGPRNAEFSPVAATSGAFGPKNADFSPESAESVAFGPKNAEFSPVAAENGAFGPRNADFSPESAESGAFGPKNAEFSPESSESVASGPQNAEFSPGEAGGEPLCAEVELGRVPLSSEVREVCARRGWDAAELAVSGGEDYELLVTLAPEAFEAARAAVLEASGGSVCLSAIGTVLGAGSVEGGIRWSGGDRDDYQGFTHF